MGYRAPELDAYLRRYDLYLLTSIDTPFQMESRGCATTATRGPSWTRPTTVTRRSRERPGRRSRPAAGAAAHGRGGRRGDARALRRTRRADRPARAGAGARRRTLRGWSAFQKERVWSGGSSEREWIPARRSGWEPIQEPGSASAKPLGSLGSLSGPRVTSRSVRFGRYLSRITSNCARQPDRRTIRDFRAPRSFCSRSLFHLAGRGRGLRLALQIVGIREERHERDAARSASTMHGIARRGLEVRQQADATSPPPSCGRRSGRKRCRPPCARAAVGAFVRSRTGRPSPRGSRTAARPSSARASWPCRAWRTAGRSGRTDERPCRPRESGSRATSARPLRRGCARRSRGRRTQLAGCCPK